MDRFDTEYLLDKCLKKLKDKTHTERLKLIYQWVRDEHINFSVFHSLILYERQEQLEY